MRIQEELVKKIIDLQDKHKDLVDKLNHIYATLNITKDHLVQYKTELDNLDNDNIKNREKLQNILLKYESQIKKLNSDLKPYLDEMETLNKMANKLYLKLIELFPNTDEQEIKLILQEHIEKYKNDNNID